METLKQVARARLEAILSAMCVVLRHNVAKTSMSGFFPGYVFFLKSCHCITVGLYANRLKLRTWIFRYSMIPALESHAYEILAGI